MTPTEMNRRDALTALASLVAATGMSVTPVTTKDASDVALVVLRIKGLMKMEVAENIKRYWDMAVDGTPLEGVKVAVIDDQVDVEFVRR